MDLIILTTYAFGCLMSGCVIMLALDNKHLRAQLVAANEGLEKLGAEWTKILADVQRLHNQSAEQMAALSTKVAGLAAMRKPAGMPSFVNQQVP